MANKKLNKAKCERLFGITSEFWWRNPHVYLSAKDVWSGEYENNAHPNQEYLADLRTQRAYIAKQLKINAEYNILDAIDKAIEATMPLAMAELLGEEPHAD